MKTADEMLQYVKIHKLGSSGNVMEDVNLLRYFAKISIKLQPGESAIVACFAWFNDVYNECAYAITNKRILWEGKKTAGEIDIDDIVSTAFSTTQQYGPELGFISIKSYAQDVMISHGRELSARIYKTIKKHINI